MSKGIDLFNFFIQSSYPKFRSYNNSDIVIFCENTRCSSCAVQSNSVLDCVITKKDLTQIKGDYPEYFI
jgi:hypothetical protein